MKSYWILLLFLLNVFVVQGQTQIKGKVFDETKKQAVANAMVVLYDESTNKMLEHAQSNKDGVFSLSHTYNLGIYKLEVSKMGYQKQVQQIVIGTDSSKSIDIKVILGQKSTEIKELTLTAVRPIIVKKDTIIYDVEHFTEKHNETLEEVLAKIKGFKVLPNGEIEVEGKLVRKVLIDGKEVSDFGAGLITKSLSPDKVKNVEIRFDEKNKKLKESLLDGEKFVVLDISLKENVKKSFFGKQRIEIGYQDKLKLGGLTNLFSLNPKMNIQFFAESNNWGNNEIELYQIRNIGDESMAKIFTMPVDIDDMKQRMSFHDEMYGFRNYTANDKSIMGLSMNVPLSKKADLYIGSFSNYQYLTNQFLQESWFDQSLIYHFRENNFTREYQSKNKIQLKYTADKLKLNSNINYVFSDQNLGNLINREYYSRFSKKHFSNNWYFNQHLEYMLKSKLGLFSSLSYSQENYNTHARLYTDNEDMNSFLGINDFFSQQNRNTQYLGNGKLGLTYKSDNIGTHSWGYRYHFNRLKNEKKSNSLDFNAAEMTYKSRMHSVFYDNFIYWTDFSLRTDLAYSFMNFPYVENGLYTRENKNYFQYKLDAEYKMDAMSSIHGAVTHQIDFYPLSKATFGNVLMDFQTIYWTNQEIAPFYNTTYMLSYDKNWKKSKIYIAYLRGISNNLNNQSFSNDFIFTEANQLSSKYHTVSVTYDGKELKKLNLKYTFEPEFLINSSEYLRNNQVEHTTAYRYMAGLKLFYKPKNKKISVYYYPKYSHFIFGNSTTDYKTHFNFLSNKVELNLYFFEQKLMTELGFRQVNFLQNGDNFNNLDIKLVYKTDKYKYFFNVGNLLNSKNFTTQDFNQSLLNINQNRVFSRYFNLGFEFRIN